MRGRYWSRHCRLRSMRPSWIESSLRHRGNPLALVELPKGLTPKMLAGGFGMPSEMTFSASIEEIFNRRLGRPPGQSTSPIAPCSDRSAPEIRRWSGGPPTRLGIAESDFGQGRVGRPVGSCPASRIPSSARSFSGLRSRRHDASDARPTACWRKRLIQNSIRIVVPGTGLNRLKQPDEDVASELEDSAARARGARWLRCCRCVSRTGHGVDT